VETALSDGGGNIIVGNGGTASATTISNGGVETVSSGGTSLRDVISAGGTAIISSGGFAGGDTIDGGAFIIVTSATISNGITFGPVTGGVLSLSAPPLMASATLLGGQAITGFTSSGDTIAISGYALSTGAKMTEVSSGVAVLSNGAESFTLDIAGIPLGDTFKLAAGTGSIIDITGFSCFLAGTGIMTPSGLRRVEDLGKGDLVLTAAGEAKPIRWIGHRHVTIADRTDADLHAPICFLRDAIADGKPARDLWVTPDHAILVRDKLIPAKLLVNGSTIRKVPRAEYRFYHIELERHDLLLAEGLEAESYLDVVDSRRRFDNNPFTSLRHDLSLTALTEQAYAARGCHPITLNPEAVRPVWQALADRAEARFAQNTTRWTPEPDLRLRVAGKELQPAISENGTYVFILPGDAGEATILSRAASPWQRRPWIDDRRQLGVAIREITCATAHGTQKLPLDSSGLMAGWHGVEGAQGEAYRWTNGAAGLPLPPDTNCVVLKLVGSAEYPLEPAEGDAPDLQLTEPRLMPDRPIARAG
jgi:autotransporter passenger strand-loop-strand repeat protein